MHKYTGFFNISFKVALVAGRIIDDGKVLEALFVGLVGKCVYLIFRNK